MKTTNNKEKEHKEQQQMETTTQEYKMPWGWNQTNKLLFLNRQMEYLQMFRDNTGTPDDIISMIGPNTVQQVSLYWH